MNTSLDLSIVIVNYNTKKITLDCIDSVYKNTKDINYEIILVENSSDDPILLKDIKKDGKKINLIVSKENLGFAAGNNSGIKIAKGRYVLLLNSDTLVTSNVLAEMVSWMDENPKVGISSCALKNKDGSLQGTGGYFPTLIRVFSWMTIQDFPFVDLFIKPFHPTKEKSFSKNDGFYTKERELDWVTGAFFLIRKEVIDQIGLIDEEYFMYTEETDFCFRARQKGWRVIYNPRWSIIHFGGASSKGSRFSVLSEYKNVKLFYKKHYPKWQYPLVRLFLKIGALGRIVVLGTIRGSENIKIYAEAFRTA